MIGIHGTGWGLGLESLSTVGADVQVGVWPVQQQAGQDTPQRTLKPGFPIGTCAILNHGSTVRNCAILNLGSPFESFAKFNEFYSSPGEVGLSFLTSPSFALLNSPIGLVARLENNCERTVG